MKKNLLNGVCYAAWIGIAIVFFLLLKYTDVDVFGGQAKGDYEELTDYNVETMQDPSAPTGIRKVYDITLDGIKESYCELVFFTIHQTSRVYLDDTCIYSMQMKDGGFMGRSPGYTWNALSFSEEDNGKNLRIEITPVYSSSNEIEPVIYLGNRYDMARDVIKASLWDLLFSTASIVVGMVYIIFVAFNNRKTKAESSLAMLGFLAIQLGIWRFSDSKAVNFLLPGRPEFSQITFLSLMFIATAMGLHIKQLYSTRRKWVWYISIVLGFANIVITLLLQFLGVADMRQMLPFTHVVMAICIVVTIVMTIYEIRHVELTKKLKLHVVCLSGCFAGAIIDMGLYYATNGVAPSAFTMVGFMVYTIVLGTATMHEVKELMKFGIRAKRYEKLAYYDQLTGLYNRTAYEEFTKNRDFNPEDCVVLIMDLNNLKSCNDSFGHDKGDVYIKEAAKTIGELFGNAGNCYRMGGDEFYVLAKNETSDDLKDRIKQLQEHMAACKSVDEDFKMGIACGFRFFDKNMDRDISETVRRADKAMYQDKFAMKS